MFASAFSILSVFRTHTSVLYAVHAYLHKYLAWFFIETVDGRSPLPSSVKSPGYCVQFWLQFFLSRAVYRRLICMWSTVTPGFLKTWSMCSEQSANHWPVVNACTTLVIYAASLFFEKQGTKLLSISWPNIDRFSNFFHWQAHFSENLQQKWSLKISPHF